MVATPDWRLFDDATERLLLENDPTVITVKWMTLPAAAAAAGARNNNNNNHEFSTPATPATRLGRALGASTHVTQLFVDLKRLASSSGDDDDDDDDVALLLQWIEESVTLKEFYLVNANRASGHAALALPRFLMAIARRSTALELFVLGKANVSAEHLISLVQSSKMEHFAMDKCEMRQGSFFATEAEAAQHVAAAFGSPDNQTLQKLQLVWTATSAPYVHAILHALRSNTRLETLCLKRPCRNDDGSVMAFPLAASNAVADLIRRSTGPLRVICLIGFHWSQASFAPISQSLQDSPNIKEIGFSNCRFDGASCLLLHSMLDSSKTTAKTLRVHGAVSFPDKVLESLVGSSSGLEGLDLRNFDRWDDADNGLGAIVHGLKATSSSSSSVKKLSLPELAPVHCELLLQGIPCFRSVSHIEFSLGSKSAALKDRLLKALKGNASLLNIVVTAPFWNEDDLARIRLYEHRNQTLPGLIASTTMCEQSQRLFGLIPRLFRASFEATAATGPWDVLQALLRLGNRVGQTDLLLASSLPEYEDDDANDVEWW